MNDASCADRAGSDRAGCEGGQSPLLTQGHNARFLGVAFHELKSPLTLIKGYSDMLVDTMRERMDDTVYGMVVSINRAAERLHRVLNNILDAARIENGHLSLSLESFDIAEAIEESIEEFRGQAQQRSMVIAVQVPPDLPQVHADRQRVQHVVANLLSNALRFSPDGSTVRVRASLKDGERICVMMEDEGVGIPREQQARVFTPPQHAVDGECSDADGAASILSGGTGLGLSTSKSIIEKHGGCIRIESPLCENEAHPGSRFTIELPLRPSESACP